MIDKVGLFLPALITELTFLGEKVYFNLKRDSIITEVTALIDYLENYANRELGDEKTPLVFEGTYCRCGIMIIAKRYKVIEIGDIKPYVDHVKKLLERKIEDIYLIGPAYEENIEFIDEISDKLQEDIGMQRYHEKKYESRIIFFISVFLILFPINSNQLFLLTRPVFLIFFLFFCFTGATFFFRAFKLESLEGVFAFFIKLPPLLNECDIDSPIR